MQELENSLPKLTKLFGSYLPKNPYLRSILYKSHSGDQNDKHIVIGPRLRHRRKNP